MATCYRHPDRETGVSCSRCGRPICPDCMTPTSVGMRCPECASDSTQVRSPQFSGPGSGAAKATTVLIAINVGVFVVQLFAGGGAVSSGGGDSLALNGALCGNGIGDGGFCGARGIGAVLTEGGEWWRVLTGGFLHSGLIHLALNMFVLYILGQVLEPAIGTARFVALYIVSLIAGSLGAILMTSPEALTVGASGAIYGLFLATLLIARHRGLDQVVAQLGFWLVLNLVITFTVPGISIGGHLGGALGGALVALLVIAAERRAARGTTLGVELGLIAGIGVAAFVVTVLVATAGVAI